MSDLSNVRVVMEHFVPGSSNDTCYRTFVDCTYGISILFPTFDSGSISPIQIFFEASANCIEMIPKCGSRILRETL